MTAYYNEIDPAAAHVLRHLIADGVIAPGDVDERSIKEVQSDDLKGYTQAHFFAGGGLWSVAARLAGWPDDEPLWTGSCPCQPFSAAGKGGGTDDPRHLWPDFYRLIRARRPAIVMGEQVAAKAGYGWFDGVSADLAAEDYASRSVDFPACSIDAPHQRNRQYWIALADHEVGKCRAGLREDGSQQNGDFAPDSHGFGRKGPLDHSIGAGLEGQSRDGDRGREQEPDRPVAEADGAECLSSDASIPFVQGQPSAGHEPHNRADAGLHADAESERRGEGRAEYELRSGGRAVANHHAQRNGTYWSDAEWIICHDGKARRAKPGLCFLVDGLPGRVDLWRIGGNAIVPEAAAEVIASFIDVYGLPSSWGMAT